MTTPHDAPTAGELIEAVVEFLGDPLFGVTPEEHRFHLRVAINVLEIVRRELTLGPGQTDAHRERLRALGVADDGELASRIRSGEVDPRPSGSRFSSPLWTSCAWRTPAIWRM